MRSTAVGCLLEALPGHGHLGADRYARVEVEHILVVHADATFRHGRADRPGRIGPMNSIERRAQVKCANTERVAGMTAGNICRQLRIFAPHGRCRCPRRIDTFLRNARYARPAALLAWHRNRVGNRFTALVDPIELAITERYDDLARTVLWRERNNVT